VQEAIKKWGHKIPGDEVMAIMAAADVDGDGVIDYNEFVAATINVNQLEKEELIYKAFQQFDTDNSNSISMDELEKARALTTRLLLRTHVLLRNRTASAQPAHCTSQKLYVLFFKHISRSSGARFKKVMACDAGAAEVRCHGRRERAAEGRRQERRRPDRLPGVCRPHA
jgi:EF hand